MKEILLNPTPKQFFYIVLVYTIIVLCLGVYLAGGFLTFLVVFGYVILLYYVYSLTKNAKVKNKKWIYFCIPLILLYSFIVYSGILFHKDFVTDKSQLKQTTGILPAKFSEHHTTGKNGKTYQYLKIGKQHFNCNTHIQDTCDKVYTFKGIPATIYYQTDNEVNNLVYEIVVNNHVIYAFDSQLKAFQEKRKQEYIQWLWAIIIFVLPMIYLFILHKKVIATLDVMTKEEAKQYDDELEQKLQEQRKQMVSTEDSTLLGTLSMVLGSMIVLPMSIVMIVYFFKAKYGLAMLLLATVLLVFSILIYLPYSQAKTRRDERIAQQKRLQQK